MIQMPEIHPRSSEPSYCLDGYDSDASNGTSTASLKHSAHEKIQSVFYKTTKTR